VRASRACKGAPGRGRETCFECVEVSAWRDVSGGVVGRGHHFDKVVAVRDEVEGPRGGDGGEGEVLGRFGHGFGGEFVAVGYRYGCGW
jgi:hypothetical protein